MNSLGSQDLVHVQIVITSTLVEKDDRRGTRKKKIDPEQSRKHQIIGVDSLGLQRLPPTETQQEKAHQYQLIIETNCLDYIYTNIKSIILDS